MARIIISETALDDAQRLFDFLNASNPDAAARAGNALVTHISRLEQFPESMPRLHGQFRILTVPFGKRGYSVAYVYQEERDTVVVLGIKHQSEEYFPFEFMELDDS